MNTAPAFCVLLLLAVGCGGDPCDGEATCLTLELRGDVGPIDGARGDLSGVARRAFSTRSPSGATPTPVLVPILLPPSRGSLALRVIALRGERPVGLGTARQEIVPLEHYRLAVTLAPLASPTCSNGVLDSDESDVDCGGPCLPCETRQSCRQPSDCRDGLCQASYCAAPSCGDGLRNGDESDADCGGSCPPCALYKGCLVGVDCRSATCTGNRCASSCSDQALSGDETDVDCGGSCPPCGDHGTCRVDDDCASAVCANLSCAPSSCGDGVRNASESDVDCGGTDGCPRCSDGQRCDNDGDCRSAICGGGRCAIARCDDSVKNRDETDVDCGGPACSPCGDNRSCASGDDCQSVVCAGGRCAAATCSDAVKNGAESDIDCGGGCSPCLDNRACQRPADCSNGVCLSSRCAPPTCMDATKNGNETADDCGGGVCPPCADNLPCRADGDCQSKVCEPTGNLCLAPTCGDARTNGAETDVDCGGPTCTACAVGKACLLGRDCQSGACLGTVCAAANCNDGVKNNDETDVDCGGLICGRCPSDKACLVAGDCQSKVCTPLTHTCAAPTCMDATKNGAETDVDCGGGTCSPCASQRSCLAPTDCQSGICTNGTCTTATCTDGVKNGSEIGVDCGGPNCPSCAPPVLTGVSPVKASTAGGVTLTLTGSNFFTGAGLAVTINGRAATNVSLQSSTQLSVTLPSSPGTIGPVPVVVSNPDGQQAARGDLFSYYTTSVTLAGAASYAASSPHCIASADFNGDGKPDLAMSLAGSTTGVLVFLQGSNLTFTQSGQFGAGACVAAADVTHDGKADLVEATLSSVCTYPGNGNGGFGAPLCRASTLLQGVALGDLNGDGELDVAGGDLTNVVVLLGSPSGQFQSPQSFPSGGNDPTVAVIRELTGDGTPDVAVVDVTSGNYHVLPGKGDGSLLASMTFNAGTQPSWIAADDLNGDGNQDLVVSVRASNLRILLGDGTGNFGTGSYALSTQTGAAIADMNGDGFLDIVATLATSAVAVILGNGNGSFAQTPLTFPSAGQGLFLVTDLDGDRRPDLALADPSGLRVVRNISQ